jgi:hypothetical protein
MGFWFKQIWSCLRPFVAYIAKSYTYFVAGFRSCWGSYHEYSTYLAISHSNIEISMEWSQLTGLRLIQILFGAGPVVYCNSKHIYFLQQVLGLDWVYLATEGIISLGRRNSNVLVTSRLDLG